MFSLMHLHISNTKLTDYAHSCSFFCNNFSSKNWRFFKLRYFSPLGSAHALENLMVIWRLWHSLYYFYSKIGVFFVIFKRLLFLMILKSVFPIRKTLHKWVAPGTYVNNGTYSWSYLFNKCIIFQKKIIYLGFTVSFFFNYSSFWWITWPLCLWLNFHSR